MLSKMLAGIANRRNLQNWPTMLPNVGQHLLTRRNILRDFFLRQHVGGYLKLRQTFGATNVGENVGQYVGSICADSKAEISFILDS